MSEPLTPYKRLQQRCKAAGLPANKAAAVLTKLLADHQVEGNAPTAPNFDEPAMKEQWKELTELSQQDPTDAAPAVAKEVADGSDGAAPAPNAAAVIFLQYAGCVCLHA